MKAATVDPVTWAKALADKLDPPPDPYADQPVKWIRDKMDEWEPT